MYRRVIWRRTAVVIAARRDRQRRRLAARAARQWSRSMCLSTGNFTGAAAGQDAMSALTPDQCFNVAYELHKDEVTVGAIWIGVAVPLGLLFGGLLSAIVFRLCCKQWWKDNEALLRVILNNFILIFDRFY